jgi:hypothetical protein
VNVALRHAIGPILARARMAVGTLSAVEHLLRRRAAVVAGFAFAAVVYTWPLAAHLGTTLTGSPAYDGGVYVWNQWVFRFELMHGRFPYLTDTLFGPNDLADLSLHNYTIFQNLLALPLIGTLGVVTTFNLVYLFVTVLTAYTTYLLACDLGIDRRVAWVVGLLFAWSPVLVTRGMGHYSLVAAAPLAATLLLIKRLYEQPRAHSAVALGLALAWAATTDVYYAVYGPLIAAAFLTTHHISIEPPSLPRPRVKMAFTVLCVMAACTVIGIATTGGGSHRLLGHEIHARSLHTPVLILTVVTLLRVGCSVSVRVEWPTLAGWRRAFSLALLSAGVSAAMLSPFLYMIWRRLEDGEFVVPLTFWRSSPPGVDGLALLLPNPNHPLAPIAEAQWLAALPNGYVENVAALPLTALLVMLVGWRHGWRPPRWLIVMTVFFGLLALGPFITVAGHHTYIPTPWALLRYVPIIGLARTPARFAVVLTMLTAFLFGGALTALIRRRQHATLIVMVTGLAVAFELLPAPRHLYPAAVPSIYRYIAMAPNDAVVLELPFGLRDGTMSIGNFSARTQFYQTAHERTVMGGYLSRVSSARQANFEADPIRAALATGSEGREIDNTGRSALLTNGPAFLRGHRVEFVVIDRDGTSPELRELATRAFRLEPLAHEGSLELFRPVH